MNVLIDRERLVFLRKLDHQPTLSRLGELECPHHASVICYADRPEDFGTFTDLELKLLIKNTSMQDLKNVFHRPSLLRHVYELAKMMPVDDVNGFELTMQLLTLKPDDKDRYQYVKGSRVPRNVEGLAELAAKTCAGVPLAGPASVPQPPQAATPAALPGMPAGVVAATDGSESFVMPREGTSTHTIFMFCARLWKEAGFTDNKATLDNIRKKAVDQLVPTGLNISTVRTQAARWYQHRQRLVL